MTIATMSGENSTLVTKCLDICQVLTNQGRSFNFTLKIDSSFSFSLDTRDNPILSDVVKKKLSPSGLRRSTRRREEFLKRKSEAVKNSDTHLEVDKSSQVKTSQCDQCDQSFRTENGLSIHIGKTHKDKICQLEGLIEKVTDETAVKACDVTKPEDDSIEVDEVDKKHVGEDYSIKPFQLKFRKPEKKYSSDIYDSYLEEPLPLVMPQTILHPVDGIGEFHGYYKKIKNKYTYKFKTSKGMSWKTFHIGEKSPWD
jgi:hypothetical protein